MECCPHPRARSPRTRAACLLLATLAAASPARAATIIKADNPLPLDSPASWSGGVLPTAVDTALFDGTLTSPLTTTLGANTTWRALQLTNPAGDVTLANDGSTLTLGINNGANTAIDLSTATRALTLNVPLVFLGKSSANVASTLTLSAGFTSTLDKNGAGTLILAGTAAGTRPALTLNAGFVQLASPTALLNPDASIGSLNATSSTFDLAGNNALVGRLFGSLAVTNSVAAPVTFTDAVYTSGGAANFTGNLSDGAGTLSFAKTGAYPLNINATQSYSGSTSVYHGTLTLGHTVNATTNLLAPQSTLVLGGGALLHSLASAGTAVSQTLASTFAAEGASLVMQDSSPAYDLSLTLGPLARNTGATVQFSPAGGGDPGARGIFTSAPLTSSGILGGWALFGSGPTWATRDTTSASSPITALQTFSPTFAPNQNTQVSGTLAAPTDAATGSVYFGTSANTLTLSGHNTIESGGILVAFGGSTSGITTSAPTDTLTSGNGHDLIIHQHTVTTPFTIDAPIVDNGLTPIALTKSGAGTLILTRANTFSGGTYLLGGKLVLAPGASLGTGPIALTRSLIVTFNAGATQLLLPANSSLPNDISFHHDDQLYTNSLLDIATGSSATLTGNISTAPDPLNQYRLGISSGTLTLTGHHTSGSPNTPPPLYTTFWGNDRNAAYLFPPKATLVFANSSTFIAYGNPILLSYVHLVLKDNTSFSVQNLSSPPTGAGLSLGMPQSFGNYPGYTALTLQDNASLNLGQLSLDLQTFTSTNSTLRLNGGTIALARFIRSSTSASNPATLVFNGGTLLATADAPAFLPSFIAGSSNTFSALVNLGGAKIDTNSHAITIAAPLLHDPAITLASDGGLTKLGPGTLTLTSAGHTFFGPLTIDQGTVQLATPAAVKLHALSLAPSTTLDLTSSSLILQSASASGKTANIASLQSHLRTSAITSSTLNPAQFTMSLFDNADLHLTTFAGQRVDDNSLLVAPAPIGDTNLDNTVDAFDLNALASHWQQSSNVTASAGDLNADGKVDAFDLNLLAAHWQFSVGSAPLASDVLTPRLSSPNSVPEPSACLLLLVGLAVQASRRNRRLHGTVQQLRHAQTKTP